MKRTLDTMRRTHPTRVLMPTLATLIMGASAAAAQNPEIRTRLPSDAVRPAASFACGPHLTTYRVRALDSRPHIGVRCVLFDPRDRDHFVWYGEGLVDGRLHYRHVGLHTLRGGERYDISGNGEAFANATRFSLGFSRERVRTAHGEVPGRIMDRTGGGEWVLEEDGVVDGFESRLGWVERCGTRLREFSVYDDVDIGETPREGSGIRCVFPGKRAFYGEGDWGGVRYVHIAMRDEAGDGAMAADICDRTKSRLCSRAGVGQLTLGYRCFPGRGAAETVGGAWRERWWPTLRDWREAPLIPDLRCIAR